MARGYNVKSLKRLMISNLNCGHGTVTILKSQLSLSAVIGNKQGLLFVTISELVLKGKTLCEVKTLLVIFLFM